MKSLTSIAYKTLTALMIVLLALTAMPVSPAYALTTPARPPSSFSNSSFSANTGNAYASDNQYAVANGGGQLAWYSGFTGFAIPVGATINGIVVGTEGNRTGGRTFNAELSWNGGANWSNAQTLPAWGGADSTVTVGSTVNTTAWGAHTWIQSDFGNAFTVRLTASGGGGNINLDQLLITVYYTVPTPVAPAITSPNNTTFVVGATNNTFTVIATGSPAPTFSATGLPVGVTLNTITGVLSGAPAAGTVGAIPVTITASNGTLPNATQTFTLNVVKANTTLAITSDNPDPSLVGQNVTINFSITSANNTITPSGNVTVGDGVNSCSAPVTGAASPFTGSCVVAFTTSGNPRTLTASYLGDANFNAPTNVTTAHVVNASYTITLVTGTGGTIQSPYGTVVTGSVTAASGSSPIFYFVPNTNNIVASVIQDSNPVGRLNVFTFNNVTANHTLSVTFDSGWYAPTANILPGGSLWATPANAYTSNNQYATQGDFNTQTVDYTAFGVPVIPVGSTIDGIEVAIEGFTTGRQVTAQLSGNNGGSWTLGSAQTNFGGTEQTTVIGGPTDLWGIGWTPASFTNANFRVKILSVSGGFTTVSLDQVQVKVHYRQPTALTVNTASGVYGGTTTLTATLTTTVGSTPIAGQTVNFFLNGNAATPIGSAVTDINGIATLNNVNLSGINAGVYAGTYNTSGVGASYAGTAAGVLPGYLASTGAAQLTVTSATPTVSVTGGTFVYDGNTHGATGFAYGLGGVGDVLTPAVTFSYSGTGSTTYGPSPIAPTNVGTYIATASFAGNANYAPASNTAAINITPAVATVSVTGGTFVYDGTSHGATGFAYGVGGATDVLAPAVSFTYTGSGGTVYPTSATPPTDVGTYDVLASFAGNANYDPATGTATITITLATPSVSVTGGTFVYDGAPHGASGFAYGVGGVTDILVPAVTLSYSGAGYGPTATPPTDVGTYTATASFAGNANYASATATAAVIITPAASTVDVTGGTFVYDGTPHGATGFAYGLGGITDVLAPAVTFSYSGTGYGPTATPPTNVGTYTVTASFAGNLNYSSASNTATIIITTATATVDVTGGTFVYDSTPHGATGFAYGVGGIADVLVPAVTFNYTGTGGTVYSSTIAPTNVGTYDVLASFAGNTNYDPASNTTTITITPAAATVDVTGGTFVYDGTPHGATGFAYGVGGVTDVLVPAVTFTYTGTGGTIYPTSSIEPTDVGTYDVQASFAGNLNYAFAIGTATITITPAAATVDVTGGTFVYDATPHGATGFAYGVGGVTDILIPAVTFTYTGTGGTVYPTSATEPTDVGSYDVQASFAGNANYAPATGTATITITPATALISITGGTFTYDGTPHGATGFAYGVGGVGDVLTPAVTFSYFGVGPTAYGPTAIAPTDVGIYNATASFAGNASYLPASRAVTIIINQEGATVSVTGGTFTYDGNLHGATGFAYGVGGTGDVQAPAVTFVYSGTGSTTYGPSPIAPTDAGTYDATASFAGNTNYSPSTGTAAITITPATATVSVTGGTFIYSGTPHGATGFAYGVGGTGDVLTPAVTFGYTGTGGTIYPMSAIAPTDVGTYDVLASFAGNANYSFASNTATITITPTAATVSVTGGTFVYDGTPHGATGFAYGVGGTGDVLAPVVTFSYSGTGGTTYGPSVTAPTNVGTYDVTASFAGNTNYSPATDTATITITPATPTVSVTGGTFTFDGNPHGATGFAYGVGGVTDVLTPAVTFSYSGTGYGPTATPPTNVGTYTATASFAGNADYASASDTATIVINPVGVTVSVTGGTFVYDSTPRAATGFAYGVGGVTDVQAPAVTFSYTGTGATVYGPTATAPTNAGTYNATASFAGNTNYSPASNFATITITKRPIEFTAVTDTKDYDGDTSSSGIPTITAGTLVGTDAFTLTQTFDTKNAGTGKDLIPLAVVSVGNAGNYTITYINDSTGVINSIPLTISGVTANGRIYDGTKVATLNTGAAALVGVIGTDAVTLDKAGAAGTFDDKNVAPLKAVTVTGFTISGTNAGNYTLTQPTGLQADITVRPVTVSAQQNIKVYDGTTSSVVVPSISAGTLAIGDTASFTQTYDNKNVGTSKVLTPSGTVSDGNLGGNYSVTFANNGTGVINQRPLTITANPQAKALGALDPPLTYSITNGSLIAPDTLSGSLTRASGEGAGTYNILQGSVTAGPNYNLTYIGADLVIGVGAQAITVVTAAPANAAYNTNFNVTATATSGLPVTITTTGGACSGGGVNGIATITMLNGTGICTVHFNQAGDANFTAATEIVQTTAAIKADQTININTPAPANATYNTGFNVSATATSGLSVVYSAVGVCTNTGSNFSMTSGTGSCTVQYNQPGDANYNAAPQVTQTVNAQKANQTINVTTSAPANAAFASNFTVAANATSSLVVTYSSTGSCTNALAVFTMTLPTGTCTVQYNQAGNANYNAATLVTQTVNSQKANQAITVTTSVPPTAANGAVFPVAATASSGLPVAITTSGFCTGSGTGSANITMTSGTGTCTVLYNQTGNANYNAAPQVTESTNSLKANQVITVTVSAPAAAINGATFNVAATSNSGLTVAITTSGVCTGGGTGLIPITMTSSAGVCTVQFNQAGDTNYNAAPQVTNTTNAQKTDQAITITTAAPATSVNGSNFTVAATASSGLAVTYSATGTCTNVGATFTMIAGTGTCTVHYNQAGNADYNPAPELTTGVTAQKANQVITVTTNAPNSAADGTSFNVIATANSGLPVAITATGVCTGSGTGSASITVTASSGTCTVHYNQAGNTDYNLAPEVTKDVTAMPVGQTITVTTHALSSAANGSSFTVAATASSGLPVAITTSGDCSGSGSDSAVITITSSSGTCTIHYNQPGNSSNAAAPEVIESTTIDSTAPTVSINQAGAPQIDPTNVSPINFTVVFSEPVTGFTGADITITGTAGATTAVVTEIAPNDGTTYNVAISGMTTDGIVTVSIPAGAAKDISGNDSAAGTSVDDTVTYFDKKGPTVLTINTTPSTADNVLSEAENVTVKLTQFKVKFNQDVYNPVGDSDPEDVTNPNNYMLVRDLGGTAGFQTKSCSLGVDPEDTSFAIGTVTYDSATTTATFTVNGGLSISNGNYQLFICGSTSIVDPLDNTLKLVGTRGAGFDFIRNFAINVSGGGGGGGTGNGGNGNNGSTTRVLPSAALIPVTGFAPDHVTLLPIQPADKAYKPLDKIRIEIPTLGVDFPIVGVSLSGDNWDLTWLKENVGYLEGSAYPTFNGNTVLTAHVIDSNNNLGPFSDIKGMHMNDKIFIHAYGKVYVYQVQENQKILPSNISTVFKHEEYSWVTLVTCEDYDAKAKVYKYRRMVRAVLVSVVEEQ